MEYIKVHSGGSTFEIPQLKACEEPRQIRWTNFDSEYDEMFYGIQIGDKVICSCCGGVFPIYELNEQARLDLGTNWVEISERWIGFENEMTDNW